MLPPSVHLQRQPKSSLRLVRCCSDSGFHGFNLGIAARITRVLALGLQRFLISGGKLANRCRVLPVYTLLRAVILDFRARLENRCRVFPVYGLLRAVILDFRGSIWESLHGFALKRHPACSDS